jgi:hypothetical protein
VRIPPARQTVGQAGKESNQRLMMRRLTEVEREAIHSGWPRRWLRTLAADFGVSHETVRAVLRHGGPPTEQVVRCGGGQS